MSQPQKKCPHCHQWSSWNQKVDDTCQHCNGTLSPKELKEQKEEEARDKSDNFGMELKLITINEDDHPLLKLAKRLIQGGQLLFFAIVSFVVWLATAIAG